MQIKTISTATGVNEIDFGNDSSQSTAHFYWLKNLGDSTLYVSAKPDPIAEKDDVAELPAKGSVSVETDEGKIYVLGAGKVEIHRTNSKFCPFDWQSSGSGGGGGGSITVDSELSDTSTNPLQNKVTTAAINEVNSSVETLEAALTQTQEDVSANTAALETKSDINHIHDISASGNPVIMDNLQGGAPFSEIIVSGKNLFGDVMNYYLSGTQQDGFNFKPSSANSFCFFGTIINNTNYTIKNYSDGNRFKIVLFKNYPNQAAPDECMEILPTDSNTVTFNSGEYNYCVLSVAYNDENITIKKAQLELGDTATAYEPPITGRGLTVNVSGKNLLSYPYNETTKTVNGITFTDNGGGSVTVKGTATARSVFWFKQPVDNFVLPKNTPIYISAAKEQISNVSIGCGLINGNEWITAKIIPITGAVDTFDYEKFDRLVLNITVDPGSAVDTTLYPQFELGDTATAYEPYHGSTTTITPTSNPYIIPNDINQQEGYNVISVSAGELSVVGVQKNAAIKKIWNSIGNISAQNIKSVSIEGTTSEASLLVTDLPTATTKIINVLCFTHALIPNAIFTDDVPFWTICFRNVVNDSAVVKNRDVSLIIYYIDESDTATAAESYSMLTLDNSAEIEEV